MTDNTHQFSPEEIEYAEHTLQADIKKLKNRIERIKAQIEELQPKGILGSFKSNKSKIAELKEQLTKLEENLIDLEVMTGTDYILYNLKNQERKGFSSVVKGAELLNKAGSIVEVASGFIPGVGGAVGKIAGSILGAATKKNKK